MLYARYDLEQACRLLDYDEVVRRAPGITPSDIVGGADEATPVWVAPTTSLLASAGSSNTTTDAKSALRHRNDRASLAFHAW